MVTTSLSPIQVGVVSAAGGSRRFASPNSSAVSDQTARAVATECLASATARRGGSGTLSSEVHR